VTVRIQPRTVGAESYALLEGDSILVSYTHQIEIGRDKSWVKYEYTTRVQQDEATEDAMARAIGHADQGVMKAVHQAVETVRSQQ
jgi:hypothetical protein